MKEYIMRYENEVLQLLPDKMQELVRCKDCKHFDHCYTRPIDRDDWFCADGEDSDCWSVSKQFYESVKVGEYIQRGREKTK